MVVSISLRAANLDRNMSVHLVEEKRRHKQDVGTLIVSLDHENIRPSYDLLTK